MNKTENGKENEDQIKKDEEKNKKMKPGGK